MMPTRIRDLEVRQLAMLSETLKVDYLDDEQEWEGSPFAWIKTRPSRQRGAIGEKLVSGWLASRGFNVARSPDSEADRVIENKRVEIKFSTLWRNGCYKFQQLRDQRYDFAICLGLSPFDAHAWVLEKSMIMHAWHESGHLSSQHGGQSGVDTAWLSVDPQQIPGWLKTHGGPLRSALQVISDLTGYQPSFEE